MSAFATASISDVAFQVEVTRDGNLIFLDHDVEYDLAMAEFGESKSSAVALYNSWKQDAPSTISWCFDLDHGTMILLAADWATQSMYVFDDYIHNKWVKGKLKVALDKVRAYVESDFDSDLRRKVFLEESKINDLTQSQFYDPARYAARSVLNVLNASQAATAEGARQNIDMVSTMAAQAISCHDPNRPDVFHPSMDNDLYKFALGAQTRRFVDAMEAVQAGKGWPPLGATK
jgi:hypothetical protein